MNHRTSLLKMGIIAIVTGAAGAILPMMISSAVVLSLMTQAVIYAVAALGVGFLLKQNGGVTFGNAMYYGMSGYGISLVSNTLGLSTGPSIIGVILLTGLFAFCIGFVIVRSPGIAFAMITLAIGQVFFVMASKARGVTGGADGMVVQLSSSIFGLRSAYFGRPGTMFVICWITLVIVILILSILLRTRFGPLTEAIRDNEERARFIGFKTLFPRAAIYAISAMICSIAGILSALYTTFVSPESLHWSLSGSFLIAALLGGSSMLIGPVIGAIAYFLLQDVLSEVTSHWLSILGIWLILVVVFWPDGISGGLKTIAEKFRLSNSINKS
ncbi:MAG: branched-chain amino acid ABC transporter permease [Desulfatirhabdiaceae bacterium]